MEKGVVRGAKTMLAVVVVMPGSADADANAPGAMVWTPAPMLITRFMAAVALMGMPAASNCTRNNSANALELMLMEPTFTVIVGLAIFSVIGYNYYKYYIL